ncbi:hypothetical protein pb186bvf_014031 [Paramecium bursaria]
MFNFLNLEIIYTFQQILQYQIFHQIQIILSKYNNILYL